MKRVPLVGIFVVLAALGFLLYDAVFTVHQTRQAIVLQFGDPKRVITQSGLHLKLPFIQNVIHIDKRILALSASSEEVIASDQKRLVVDAFARYRITDPLQFYITVGTIQGGELRLQTLLNSGLRSILGRERFVDVVRDKRAVLMTRIRDLVNQQAQELGIEIVDVRIRRADLPEANSQAIFERMQTERQQEAAQIRAIGQEDAREIRARADKNVTVIQAEANRDAEITRGRGDACRNRVFAAAFGLDPQFFAFYRSMQSYERALQSEDTSLVLSPDSEFFLFFRNPNAIEEKGGVQPESGNTEVLNLQEGETLQRRFCPNLDFSAEQTTLSVSPENDPDINVEAPDNNAP